MRIASSQYNFRYGEQVHLPYSIACLASYARAQGLEADWLPTAVLRDRHTTHRQFEADVFLGSCYVWNWRLTLTLAEEMKRRGAVVVLGGPHVPERIDGWFARHPFVDAVVHGEGEVATAGLLARLERGEAVDGLPGVSTPTALGCAAPRISDLSALPSPYLTGVAMELAEPADVTWVAAWETNRGCPYACHFCDWGSATYTKLRQYPMDRLEAEAAWFCDQGIPYLDCCDANFGILPRDQVIARWIAEASLESDRRHGHGITFRQSWAKMSSEKVVPIAKELQRGGSLTAVGLALESLDPTTLETVKRKNIRFDDFATLTRTFSDAGLPTYTEIIRGLPGETLDSFCRGLEEVVSHSSIGSVYVYNCGVLPNAPMAAPAYLERHCIETVFSPIFLAHSKPGDAGELEEIVVATATMTRPEMREAYLASWAVLAFESLGLLSVVSAALMESGAIVSRVGWYGDLMDAARRGLLAGIFADEYAVAETTARLGYAGDGWDHVDPRFGEIVWPLEEATWLRLTDSPEVYRALVRSVLEATPGARDDEAIVDAQVATIAFRPEGMSRPDWAREAMWHGRRRKRFLAETWRRAA